LAGLGSCRKSGIGRGSRICWQSVFHVFIIVGRSLLCPGEATVMPPSPPPGPPPRPGQPQTEPVRPTFDTQAPPLATPPPAGASGAELQLKPGAEPGAGYVLHQRLGKGGFGEVWRAAGPGGIAVALKFVALGDRAGAVEQRALQLMMNVRHA